MTTRRYHANELERRTRLRTLEGQARILLNDLAEYRAWLECYERRPIDADEAADRWLREVYRPTQAPDHGVGRARTATSSRPTATSSSTSGCCRSGPGRDVGLDAAIESYLAEGAPAPERPAGSGDAVLEALDVESDDPEYDGAAS